MSASERAPNPRYEEYLRSSVWREKRDAVFARAQGKCEVDRCGMRAKHVHHLRYPKILGDESLSDLVAVCADHHDNLHGVLPVNLPTIYGDQQRISTPGGRILEALVFDGHAYASREAWFLAMRVPRSLQVWLTNQFELRATMLQNSKRKKIYVGQFNGVKHYIWHVPLEALQNWMTLRQLNQAPYDQRDPEHQDFLENMTALKEWLGDLSSKAIAVGMRGGAMTNQPEALSQAMLILADLQKKTMAVTEDHGRRIELVEHIIRLDGSDGILADEACLELGVNQYQVTNGRLTLAQDAGNRLRAEGSEKLGEKPTRFHDSSLTRPVSVWRRRDLYRVIGQILGRDFMNRVR